MLLGLWLAGSMVTTFIAADSANTAGRILLDHPPAASLRINSMGEDEARLLLAYPVKQQARWWLVEWQDLELVLGAVFFFFLLFASREGTMVLGFALAMFALAFFQRFFTLPQMLYLGNVMDFVPVNRAMPERNQLTAVQTAFAGLEIFKILMGFGLGIYLIARSRRSDHTRKSQLQG